MSPAADRRAARLAGSIRASVERDLLRLADRPAAAEAAEALREAVAALSRALDAEPGAEAGAGAGAGHEVVIEALDRAAAAIGAARERLPEGDASAARLDRAARWLREAQGLARAPVPLRAPAPAAPQGELLASVGVPRVHRVDVPPPRVLAREEQEGGALRSAAALPASGELLQLRALARDCFEDLASLGSLRRLYDEERWIDAAGFEQRLLDNLDAVVALERPLDPRTPALGLVEALYLYATEWTIPDPGRSFALAFTLSCLASEAALRWVLLALRRADPRAYPAFADALALGSSPAIDGILAELAGDPDPALAAVALEAAARRGRAEAGAVLILLVHPDAELACRAVALAARLPAAIPLLASLVEQAPPRVAASAAAALVMQGDPRGAAHLRELLRAGPGEEPEAAAAARIALETLCLLGDPADRALLAVAAAAAGELHWLGWHGHVDHVPLLVDALRKVALSPEQEPAERLARALDRIVGPRAPAPRPRGEGAAGYEAELAAWARDFEAQRPAGAQRLRRGRAFSAAAIVEELLEPETKQGARRVLARELALATRGAAHIDVEGWVVAQRHALGRARELLPPER